MSSSSLQLLAAGASRKRKERDGADATNKTKAEPVSAAAGNRLLAGYMAHEFLTKGTILGRGPVQPVNPTEPASPKPTKAYADVALLLKSDGAHIPGVVNPTQLGRWLQI